MTSGCICQRAALSACKAAAALDVLFAGVRGVRCVVMNACWSLRHAKTIANSVDCVVGVSDEAAIGFVTGFYHTLGAGGSVQQAFDRGRGQMQIAAGAQKLLFMQLPRLYTKTGVDAGPVYFGAES